LKGLFLFPGVFFFPKRKGLTMQSLYH